MLMAKVNVGIIGIGGAGRAHAHRFLRNNYVASVRGYDIKNVDFDRISVSRSFSNFISDVDIVSICSPDATHGEFIKSCIEKGKHVLVEKPMVASYEEAIGLEKCLKDNPDLKFSIHHQMRFVPAFQKAKELMQSGELGDIFYIEANYWHNMRDRNTLYDDWRVSGKGQSVIFGAACHPVDLILYLVGSASEVVSHHTLLSKNAYKNYVQPYTSASSLISFANGIIAKCHTNNCAIFPQFNNLVILGDKASYIDGLIFRDDVFREVAGYYKFDSRVNLKLIVKSLFDIIGSKVFSTFVKKFARFRLNPFSAYNHEYACRVVIDSFVESVVHNTPVLVNYEDGCRVIKLCEEMEKNTPLDLKG